MKNLKVLAVCAVVLAIMAPAVAALTLPNLLSAPLTEASNVNLVVYQIGLTHVTMTFPVEFVDSKATIILPSSAILQTLRITGVDIVAMTLKQIVPQQLLLKGDSIIVHTQSANFQGTYEGTQDNYLILMADGKSTLVEIDAITAVEVSRAVVPQTQTDGLTLIIEADVTGSKTLNISFLSRSTSWEPSHLLDLMTGQLQTWATVSSGQNWTGASLTLVVGQPHIVYAGMIPIGKDERTFAAMSSSSSPLGEYHAYKYDKPFTITAGDVAMIRLLAGTVEVEKEYFWSDGYSDPVEFANVTNTLDQPIPEGIVQFYRAGEWVGNDWTPYIAVASNAKLTVGYAHDLKVLQKTTNIEHLASSDRITIQVRTTNYKTEAISITIQQYLPYRATLESSDPPSIQEGSILTWKLSIGPGESKLITYTYSIPIEKNITYSSP
jgi:hypothetical protein